MADVDEEDYNDHRANMSSAVSRPVEIPEHLRRNAPDPLAQFTSAAAAAKKSAQNEKSSAELTDEAARLQEEIAQLKAKSKARMEALAAARKRKL